MEEPRRDREISYELPPQTFIERSRDIRQVSHCEWALARRARAQSRRLQEQARELLGPVRYSWSVIKDGRNLKLIHRRNAHTESDERLYVTQARMLVQALR